MIDIIFALILFSLVLVSIELRKTYHEIPKKELKYRAVHADPLAEVLYRAAAYDKTLDAFLWTIIILSGAGSVVLINSIAPGWIGFITVALLIWLAFAWLPKAKTSKISTRIVVLVTPMIAMILNYIHPMVQRIARWTKSNKDKFQHTKVYDKKGLNDFIERQKSQTDNRISDEELDIIERSINLSETKVSQVATPWSKIKVIKGDEMIGPILLDELHKHDQSFVPVVLNQKSNELVGILNLTRLSVNSSGLVSLSMDSPVYYLNENDSMSSALKSFAVTNTPVFIVVDQHKNLVGMLSFNHIVKQLIGHIPGNDYEQYSSIDLVAAKYKTKPIKRDLVEE